MNQIKRQINRLSVGHLALLLFFIMILLGVLVANLFQGQLASIMEEYNRTIFSRITGNEINRAGLFRFILVEHLKEYFFYWILSITILGIPYMGLKISFHGFTMGFFISVATMQYGLKGILLIIVYAFPHGLIYLPIMLLCLVRGFRLNKSIYHESRNYKVALLGIAKEAIILVLALGVVLIIGCFLEAYVGSYLLKKTLEIIT